MISKVFQIIAFLFINCLDFYSTVTKVLMRIANQEPKNSNYLIYLADGRWSSWNKTDVPYLN